MKNEILDNIPKVSRILKLLGNESRLKVLCFLSDHELNVSELEKETGLSQSQISQILKQLELNQIVKGTRDGKYVNYEISSAEIKELFKSLHRIFCQKDY